MNCLFTESKRISPQQRAELRQMAVDDGIIEPSTLLAPTETAPPKEPILKRV
jgi:hypothetical protein